MLINRMYFLLPMGAGICFALLGWFLRKSPETNKEGKMMVSMVSFAGALFATVSLGMLLVLTPRAPLWFTAASANRIVNGASVLMFLAVAGFAIALRTHHRRVAGMLWSVGFAAASVCFNIVLLSVPL